MQILNFFKKFIFSASTLYLFIFILPYSAYAVDSNGHWEQVGSLNATRMATGFSLLNDGRIIIIGGYNSELSQFQLASTEIYNPNTKNWRYGASMNLPRQIQTGPGVVKFSDGHILIGGHHFNNNIEGSLSSELYDPIANSWSSAANMNLARIHGTLLPLPNDKAILAGGSTGQNQWTSHSEIYDYSSNTWTPTGSLNIARDGNLYELSLSNGNVLFVGGMGYNDPALQSSEIYDPSTGEWTYSSMPFKANYTAVTELSDGKVIAAGSYVWPSTFLSDAAIYNPDTNTWTSVSPMPHPNAAAAAVLLDDGNVLVVGGSYGSTLYKETLIYNPNKDSWSSGPELPEGFTNPSYVKMQNGDYLFTAGWTPGILRGHTFIFTNGNNNSSNYLEIPYFSQFSEPWGSDEYDFASSWNPKNQSISAWGCALTSAAMILKYHGYNKFPDGTELNPGSLNTWLKNQKDGFIRNGLVNWEAIKRLTRDAKNINNLNYTALEFRWFYGKNDTVLKENISNGIPVVLEVEPNSYSSHFVVANGITESTFNIKDPAFANKTLLSDYSNNYKSMRIFTQSHTDLSSIQIVVDKNIDINSVYGFEMTNGFQAKLDPIDNDQEEGVSGETLNTYYIQNPDSGNYTISLSSDLKRKYQIDIYLYDKYANVKKKTYQGVLTKQSNNEFSIEFNKLNVEESKINRKRALGLDLDI